MRRALAILVVLLLLAGLGGVLGVHAYQDMLLLRRPATVRVQDTSRVRGWMTVRFVAQAHRVPVSDLAAQLGAPADGNITLDALARMRGVTSQQEVTAAREALAQLGAQEPSPPLPTLGPRPPRPNAAYEQPSAGAEGGA